MHPERENTSWKQGVMLSYTACVEVKEEARIGEVAARGFES